jgi:hypothetical protein
LSALANRQDNIEKIKRLISLIPVKPPPKWWCAPACYCSSLVPGSSNYLPFASIYMLIFTKSQRHIYHLQAQVFICERQMISWRVLVIHLIGQNNDLRLWSETFS